MIKKGHGAGTGPRRPGAARARTVLPWPALMVLTMVLGSTVACQQSSQPQGYAGVVEFDERLVAFEVGGRLEAIDVERGALVQSGQMLARLDDSLAQAERQVHARELQVAEAQAGVVQAGPKDADLWSVGARIQAARAVEQRLETAWQRESILHEQGVTPRAQVDDLERRVEQARSERQSLQAQYASLKQGARAEEVDSARARADAAAEAVALQDERLLRYTLRSPLAGQVLEVHHEPGETVAAGTPVVTVADVASPLIEVFVPQDELRGVELGVPATLRVDAEQEEFEGRVEFIARQTEFTPRYIFSEKERPRLVVRVRVRVRDPEGRLHAGVPGFVSFP